MSRWYTWYRHIRNCCCNLPSWSCRCNWPWNLLCLNCLILIAFWKFVFHFRRVILFLGINIIIKFLKFFFFQIIFVSNIIQFSSNLIFKCMQIMCNLKWIISMHNLVILIFKSINEICLRIRIYNLIHF